MTLSPVVVRRGLVALLAALALLWPARALADDHSPPGEVLHIESPMTVQTDGGSSLRLPPGYYMPEPTYDRLNIEMHRLQDAETRLSAENDSLRRSVIERPPTVRWYVALGVGLIVGTVLGARAL